MPAVDLFYPLNEFYAEAGLPLPSVTPVGPEEIPEPCRSILVHDVDMTPTIESTFGESVDLKVLKHSLRGNVFSREIALILRQRDVAVVFGAIKIYLEYFPGKARALVLEMKQPLGTILAAERVAHSSHPSGYFRVTADGLINRALNLNNSAILYGRRNVLSDSSHRTLAQVLEILPPPALLATLISP
jgi:chorismate-pyruvate lyase